ncbi:MAG TPA: hypothetical protein VFQ09_08815, partial [Rubrobacter sp.]|nr:hypothetical protein [Rubrobacter sp.]
APRTIEIANLTDERVTYRVEALDPEEPHGKDATTGRSLGGPIAPPPPPSGEARFGERLRRWLDELNAAEMRDLPSWAHNDLRSMVAWLALDAAWLRERAFLDGLRHAREHLRRRVEEEVERARYTSLAAGIPETRANLKDVLDAEPFLEALGAIFGDRSVDNEKEADAWPEYPLSEPSRAFLPRTEHEPAHDRRERASARNEDSTGRVEGVDR